jgi:hypothetical protein
VANMAPTSWVCAILGERGLWNHLRGITRRETSVTMGSQQTIEEGKRQVSTLWRGDLRGSPSPFPFIENGTDPQNSDAVCPAHWLDLALLISVDTLTESVYTRATFPCRDRGVPSWC